MRKDEDLQKGDKKGGGGMSKEPINGENISLHLGELNENPARKEICRKKVYSQAKRETVTGESPRGKGGEII